MSAVRYGTVPILPPPPQGAFDLHREVDASAAAFPASSYALYASVQPGSDQALAQLAAGLQCRCSGLPVLCLQHRFVEQPALVPLLAVFLCQQPPATRKPIAVNGPARAIPVLVVPFTFASL